MFERKNSKPERQENAPKPAPAPAAAPKPAASPSAPATTPKGTNAMIGSKVKVKGDIISGEDLLVEGDVSGTITLSDHELIVGTSGRVEANVTAKTIRIEGEVKGDIEGTERVVICASGNVQGNVTAPRVMLEDGGRFKGSIDMGGSAASNKASSTTSTSSNNGPSVGKPKGNGAPEVHSIDKAG